MIYNISDISPENSYFWSYYFSVSFPNAYCENLDMMIDEIIEDIYNLKEIDVSNWVNEFTGYYEGVLDENDGYLDDPNYFKIDIGNSFILRIEFHPGDTRYFINDINIGSTGPHWELYCFTWLELINLVKKSEYEDLLFWLLLPMTGISKSDDIYKIKSTMINKFKVFSIISSNEQLGNLLEAIIVGIRFEEGFSIVEDIGLVCNNSNSFRKLRVDNTSEIAEFNKRIGNEL